MKKISFILLGVFFMSPLFAQVTKNDKSFTFYGLDFSKSKMVGSDGFTNPYEIVEKYFRAWNELIRNEAEKYDVRAALNKDQIEYDYSTAEKNNAKVSPSELVINNSYSITEADVAKIVKSYGSKDAKLGVLFVVEYFDKTAERASLFITYFNTATTEVLLTQRMTGKPGGFGIRNYWAAAVYDILKQAKSKSKKW